MSLVASNADISTPLFRLLWKFANNSKGYVPAVLIVMLFFKVLKYFSGGKISSFLCVCVCVCVRARVCVCVCLYSSTVKASSDCNVSKTYLRSMDQRSSVVNIYLGASAKFLHLRIWKCHISPPKTKTPATKLKATSDKKILKIRRLLSFKFFNFESSPWH